MFTRLKITNKKENEKKTLRITGLEPITSVITGKRLNQCATAASIYILANASVSIHNIIYIFNSNSRKLDGHYRSWIEYLNEPYTACTLDRSIQFDNILIWIISFFKHDKAQPILICTHLLLIRTCICIGNTQTGNMSSQNCAAVKKTQGVQSHRTKKSFALIKRLHSCGWTAIYGACDVL